MTIPLLVGVAAAALFLPGCDWFTSEKQTPQVPEGPEPPKKRPPVKERKKPLECKDPSVITKKTKIKVPGLQREIPVWYSGDLPTDSEAFDRTVESLFTQLPDIFQPETLDFVLRGKKRNSAEPNYPAKFVLTPSTGDSFNKIVFKCSNEKLEHTTTRGATVYSSNSIFLKFDLHRALERGNAGKSDWYDIWESQDLSHEILHSLYYFLNSDMGRLRDHYEEIIREIFPQPGDHERFLHLEDRYSKGEITDAEIEEYNQKFHWSIGTRFVKTPVLHSFEEYFAYRGQYFLNTRSFYEGRIGLKRRDPVAHDMFEAFFALGGLDTTPFGKIPPKVPTQSE